MWYWPRPGTGLKSGQLEEDVVGDDVDGHGPASVFGGNDVGPQGFVVLGSGTGLKSGQLEEDVVGDDVDFHVGPASVFGDIRPVDDVSPGPSCRLLVLM